MVMKVAPDMNSRVIHILLLAFSFGMFAACGGAATPDAPMWTELGASGPGARWGHVSVLDSTRDRMLVFGGVGTSGKLGDLWELRLADNAWNPTPLTTPKTAPALDHCGVAGRDGSPPPA